MRNSITINVDSEATPSITFEKGIGSPIPQNWDEARPMIVTDINCLTEGLIRLIDVADQNDYAEKDVLLKEAIAKLQAFLDLPNKRVIPEVPTSDLEPLNEGI